MNPDEYFGVLELIVHKIAQVAGIDHIFMVTNDRFFAQVEEWVAQHRTMKVIRQQEVYANRFEGNATKSESWKATGRRSASCRTYRE